VSGTILITGASSGIGRATAEFFQDKGWNVAATMRSPDDGADLAALSNVLVTRLDVTEQVSIDDAVAACLERFGGLDVLLNNAGFPVYGPLEAIPMDRVRAQFETNIIGLIAVTKAVLPHFRENRSGTLINVSSIGGQMAFPLGSPYHGSKFAVEGFSEAVYYELDQLGVRVKILEPGITASDLWDRSFEIVNDESLEEYQPTFDKVFGGFDGMEMSPPAVIAEVVWQAATDGTDTLRYRAGPDAIELLARRKAQDDATFLAEMKAQLGL
jgi:NADP-dependent 3-hydroxy acid dehydrogenase YdfG